MRPRGGRGFGGSVYDGEGPQGDGTGGGDPEGLSREPLSQQDVAEVFAGSAVVDLPQDDGTGNGVADKGESREGVSVGHGPVSPAPRG